MNAGTNSSPPHRKALRLVISTPAASVPLGPSPRCHCVRPPLCHCLRRRAGPAPAAPRWPRAVPRYPYPRCLATPGPAASLALRATPRCPPRWPRARHLAGPRARCLADPRCLRPRRLALSSAAPAHSVSQHLHAPPRWTRDVSPAPPRCLRPRYPSELRPAARALHVTVLRAPPGCPAASRPADPALAASLARVASARTASSPGALRAVAHRHSASWPCARRPSLRSPTLSCSLPLRGPPRLRASRHAKRPRRRALAGAVRWIGSAGRAAGRGDQSARQDG